MTLTQSNEIVRFWCLGGIVILSPHLETDYALYVGCAMIAASWLTIVMHFVSFQRKKRESTHAADYSA